MRSRRIDKQLVVSSPRVNLLWTGTVETTGSHDDLPHETGRCIIRYRRLAIHPVEDRSGTIVLMRLCWGRNAPTFAKGPKVPKKENLGVAGGCNL